MSFRFQWEDRLHARKDFRQAIRQGRCFRQDGLVLWVFRRPEGGRPGARIGLAVPRTFGNAVRRNRLKRILRETFRLNKAALDPRADMVFSAKPMPQPLHGKRIGPLVKQLWIKAGIWND